MMKRFWVFIFLALMASYAFAQDMPPLPSDAPSSAVPSQEDSSMPAVSDSGTTAVAAAPALQATPAAADTGGMPALPDSISATSASSSPTPSSKANLTSASDSSSSDMPALPDDSGAAASKATSAGSSDQMPPLPSSSQSASSSSVTSSVSSTATAVPTPQPEKPSARHRHEKKPWQESMERPNVIWGGWVKAKGGDISSRLSWSSQQVLNAMDDHGYPFVNEQGVYAGEMNHGPQYREFTFKVPHSSNTVIVFLKQVKRKIWLRVGPDEEPSADEYTYAQVAKIRREDLKVLHILRVKFGRRLRPHYGASDWAADYSFERESADE